MLTIYHQYYYCIICKKYGSAAPVPIYAKRFSVGFDKKGMGLGLYLVKTIIGLHGGKITVSSEINKYCRFDFYIPRKTPKKSRHENKVSKLENKNAKLPFKKGDSEK